MLNKPTFLLILILKRKR